MSDKRSPSLYNKRTTILGDLKKNRVFYLMALPGLLSLIFFSYGPMIGLSVAWLDFNPIKGFAKSNFVGWKHFQSAFSSRFIWEAIRNTFIIKLGQTLVTFPFSVLLALLLHEVGKRFRKVIQTATILPYFISWIVIGIEGVHFTRNGEQIEWLDARYTDGFPTEQGDTGAHPLASAIVSWVPQEWQDFSLLYGQDEAFIAWYEEQRENQLMYQIPNYGRNITTPAWTEFQSMSNELFTRYAIEAINAGTAEDVETMWANYTAEWMASGGEAATAEMSELLKTVYAE